jgi:hypothetical protein
MAASIMLVVSDVTDRAKDTIRVRDTSDTDVESAIGDLSADLILVMFSLIIVISLDGTLINRNNLETFSPTITFSAVGERLKTPAVVRLLVIFSLVAIDSRVGNLIAESNLMTDASVARTVSADGTRTANNMRLRDESTIFTESPVGVLSKDRTRIILSFTMVLSEEGILIADKIRVREESMMFMTSTNGSLNAESRRVKELSLTVTLSAEGERI